MAKKTQPEQEHYEKVEIRVVAVVCYFNEVTLGPNSRAKVNLLVAKVKELIEAGNRKSVRVILYSKKSKFGIMPSIILELRGKLGSYTIVVTSGELLLNEICCRSLKCDSVHLIADSINHVGGEEYAAKEITVNVQNR